MNSLLMNCIITKLLLIASANTWYLARVGLNESYRLLHLSTHRSRVFLSISVRSKSFPTLIESRWPRSQPHLFSFIYPHAEKPMYSYIYPHAELHANGNHRDCTRLQQAQWSQVDSLSRLWAMDVGWRENSGKVGNECPPKLFVFDLSKNNVEVLRIDCSKYISPGGADIRTVTLGPPASGCGLEKYIYFILAGKSHLLAYDILEQKWHRRILLSRKYDSIAEALPINPLDLTFGKEREILIADTDGILYVSRDPLLLNDANAIAEDSRVELNRLGSLLGPTKSMLTDKNAALFYVVAKFGAVVRCEPKINMTAEDNQIIYLTSQNVQQVFIGPHGSWWLLTDRWVSPQDYCFPT